MEGRREDRVCDCHVAYYNTITICIVIIYIIHTLTAD